METEFLVALRGLDDRALLRFIGLVVQDLPQLGGPYQSILAAVQQAGGEKPEEVQPQASTLL